MRLQELGKEKVSLFIDLCKNATFIDRNYAEAEIKKLEELFEEGNQEKNFAFPKKSLDEILQAMNKSYTHLEKVVAVQQLLDLMKCDKTYDKYEKRLLKHIQETLNVKDEELYTHV